MWHRIFGHPAIILDIKPNPYIARVQVTMLCSCGLNVMQVYKDGKKSKVAQP